MGTYDSVRDVRPYQIWNGAVARAVHGERITMAVIDLEPDLDVPEHSHENEQLGFVIEGAITMVIGDDSRTLGPGETYAIRSNVPHSARTGPQGATVVDVFAPTREDWERVPRLQASPGRWPH
jgi:quercetin dioxygenase-like cupin family protein